MQKIRTAVFPVAGFGTRLLPATKAIPKEMVTLIDKPLIQYTVEEVIDAGIERIIFITARTKKSLEDHFDVNIELNQILEKASKYEELNNIKKISEMVDVIYVRQKYMLGLGHAILCVKNLIQNEPFLVILPDDLILTSETSLIKQLINEYNIHRKPLLSLMKVEQKDIHKYGIITQFDKINDNIYNIKEMVEKPKDEIKSNLAIMGRYILDKSIFNSLEHVQPGVNNEIQLTDAINLLLKKEQVYGYEFQGKRFDCGSKEGLFEASLNFALQNPKLYAILQKYNKM